MQASKHATADANANAAHAAMQRGPQLKDHILTIPSEPGWWHPEAVKAWKKVGFRWQPDTEDLLGGGGGKWVRDVRRPLDGKRYRPEVWLNSVREKFFELYPDLSETEEID